MQEFELIAKTFQGLEEVLAQELTELGANNVQIGRTRIRQAASLLRTTEASVLSISEEVGYHSVSSFNRQFHDTMGQTPREWRRRMSILKDQSVMKYRGFLVPETLVQHCINS